MKLEYCKSPARWVLLQDLPDGSRHYVYIRLVKSCKNELSKHSMYKKKHRLTTRGGDHPIRGAGERTIRFVELGLCWVEPPQERTIQFVAPSRRDSVA